MKTLIQCDLPVEYPISPAELRAHQAINAIERYRDQAPPEDEEFGLYTFSLKPQNRMRELQDVRRQVEEDMLRAGYTSESRTFTSEQLVLGAGISADRFYQSPLAKITGVPYAFHIGNIEGPHGIFFVEMMREIVQRRSHRVLNMGYGPVGFQQRNIEALGVQSMVYADNDTGALETVRSYLERFGRPDVQRAFLAVDKDNFEQVTSRIEFQSVDAVIRTGVGKASEEEMAGLRHILKPDGEVFISNSLLGQPPVEFLKIMEDVFMDITVCIGFERYAVIGKTKI